MADYSKTSWSSGDLITAAKANNWETQYDTAKSALKNGEWNPMNANLNLGGNYLDYCVGINVSTNPIYISNGEFNLTAGKQYKVDGAQHLHSTSDIAYGELDGDRLPLMNTTKKGAVPPTTESTGNRVLFDNAEWKAITASGGGDVYGPEASTVNAIAIFEDASGKNIKNSVVTLDDTTGDLRINGTLALTEPGGIFGYFLKDNGMWGSPTYSGQYTGQPDYIIFKDGSDYVVKGLRAGSEIYRGSASVHGALQTAINAFAGGYGHIYVFPGSYYQASGVTMASNITLQASEQAYFYTPSSPSFHMITADARTNFEIIGGIWDINTPTAEFYQFRLENCANFKVMNSKHQSDAVATTSNTTGINLLGCSSGSVFNNYVYKGRIVMTIDTGYLTSTCLLVTNNRVFYPPKQGIICYSYGDNGGIFENIVIANNYVEHSYNDGICIYITNPVAVTSKAISIIGNTTRRCGYGDGTSDWPGIGISIGPATNGPSYACLIEGNTVYDDTQTDSGGGIGIYGGSYNIINGNTIYGVKNYGIRLIRTNTKNIVSHNTVCPRASKNPANGCGGISLITAENTLIQGNLIELQDPDAEGYYTACGIGGTSTLQTADYCMIKDNIIGAVGTGSSAREICIGGGGDYNIITGNMKTNHGSFRVSISSGTGNVTTSNYW
jgi:hypothetical protein